MRTENGYYIFDKGTDELSSHHFKLGEFECQCVYPECKDQRISLELLSKLEAMRVAFGQPITITSGYRCEKHQKDMAELGFQTAKNSQHCLGNAADIQAKLMTPLLSEAKNHFKAIGIASRFLHVDLRSDKERRWYYK